MARVFVTALGVSAVLLASNFDGAAAHSKMLVPKAVFKSESDEFSAIGNVPTKQFEPFDASIPNYKGWDRAVDAIKRSGAKTVRQFLMKYVKFNDIAFSKECGNSVVTGTKQPLPDAIDFPWGHEGPCELWCDNTRFFYDGNCNGNKVGKVKVDQAKCKGASLVQGMYIGTQAADWEVYINCVPLVGGTSADPSSLKADAAAEGGVAAEGNASPAAAPATTPASAPASSPATTPKAPAAAPSVTPKAPAAAPSVTPKTPAAAPATTPAAPAAGAKCLRKRKL